MSGDHFFISYSHEDAALVDQLRGDLEARGGRVWIDHERLTPGTVDWEASVRQGIGEARAVIYAASPNAVGSRYVKSELGLAEAEGVTVIPFWILGDAWPKVVPLGWGMTQHIDARAARFASALIELAAALGLVAHPAPAAPPRPAPAATPGQRVVDPAGKGDHYSIRDAIHAAQPGERILIRPGTYVEPLTIDKPLSIVGDGPREKIIISASGAPVILFTASEGRVANLTLRQTGGAEKRYGVEIAAGRLELEDCDISSQSAACVGVFRGADPILRRNRIHDGASSGVFIYDNAQGLLEDNDVSGNTLSGVEIKDGGAPTLRRNRVHDGKGTGVFYSQRGQGVLEDNDIFANTLSGVEIKEGSAPTVRHNRIHDGKQGGVFVQERGLGLVEDNDIFNNGKSGVEIKSGGAPTVRDNHIHHNQLSGVFIQEKGAGIIEGNEIYGNVADTGGRILWSVVGTPSAGIEVVNSTVTVRRNTIRQNNGSAIHIRSGGGGVYEENDLRGNSGGAWNIRADCLPRVTRRGNQE